MLGYHFLIIEDYWPIIQKVKTSLTNFQVNLNCARGKINVRWEKGNSMKSCRKKCQKIKKRSIQGFFSLFYFLDFKMYWNLQKGGSGVVLAMKNSVAKRKKVRLRNETWVHKQRSGLGACSVTAEQHVAFESHAPWKWSNTRHSSLVD